MGSDPIVTVLRMQAEGQELNNLEQGTETVPSVLDERDCETCAAIKPGIVEQGIFFFGIDVIGCKFMEVNVPSPPVFRGGSASLQPHRNS